MEIRQTYICEPIRTPVGKFGGVYQPLNAPFLGAAVIKGLLERTELPVDSVDDVLFAQCYSSMDAPALGRVVALGAAQWTRLNLAFVLYFMALGGLNLFIAYTFSTDFWVNFKLFGFTAIQMVFYVAVFLYFYRHISEEDRKQLFHQEKSAKEPKKKDDDAVRDNQ